MANLKVSIIERIKVDGVWETVPVPVPKEKPNGKGFYLKDHREGKFLLVWREDGQKRYSRYIPTLAEIPLEQDVSAVIGTMPFLWMDVNDAPGAGSDRAYLERNSIALLSNFGKEPIDKPSGGWLGLHSPIETIRQSGLWNTNHVGDDYIPTFLDDFKKYVCEMK